jgi:hypothetical protein
MSDSLEEKLRAGALRPEDMVFTRRVLRALPPRRLATSVSRSFALATKLGVLLAIGIAAHRAYTAGPGAFDSVVAILLGLVPAVAATRRFLGPFVPRSVVSIFRRG